MYKNPNLLCNVKLSGLGFPETPVDDEKLELLGKRETLERERQELLDSNRALEERFSKLEADLKEAQVTREKAEKQVTHLQSAIKAVDMQKNQLMNVKEELSSQLEEVNAQVGMGQLT